MENSKNKRSATVKAILILEILFFLVWRFSGWAPRPIPFGNPLFLALVTVSFFLPLSFERRNWKLMGLSKANFNGKSLSFAFLIGIILSVLGFLVIIPGFETLTNAEFDKSFFEQLRGNFNLLLAAFGISILYAGFGEEMIYRGFILNRITDFFGSNQLAKILGVIGSTVIFAMAHSYQGIVGILSSGTIGLILAIVYLRYNRNLWMVIVAHATIDIIAAILIYLSIF
ncbi:MAG: type II CAAX endopeptidase family protein [Cyclobacteriaceae bacterium]